jgi:nicotinate-nucleotide adenylyltransferase
VIGVLGGTFDPVHYGHLRPALEVYEALGLTELSFIPCRVPPHREPPEAPAHHRLAMVEQAIAGIPGFLADARELARPGPSFSVDTLEELRAEIGPGCPLLLLMGMDAFAGLHRWHRWREIPRLAHVVVAHRPGATPALDSPYLGLAPATDSVAAMRTGAPGRVYFQRVTQLGISATGIRECLRAGRSPRFLLPDSVRRYIVDHHLYRDGSAPPE